MLTKIISINMNLSVFLAIVYAIFLSYCPSNALSRKCLIRKRIEPYESIVIATYDKETAPKELNDKGQIRSCN